MEITKIKGFKKTKKDILDMKVGDDMYVVINNEIYASEDEDVSTELAFNLHRESPVRFSVSMVGYEDENNLDVEDSNEDELVNTIIKYVVETYYEDETADKDVMLFYSELHTEENIGMPVVL